MSKNIPEHIEKVAYKIMVQSTIRQKNQELLLKIPKRLVEKYGDLDE